MNILYPVFIENNPICELDLMVIGKTVDYIKDFFCNLELTNLNLDLEKLITGSHFKKVLLILIYMHE